MDLTQLNSINHPIYSITKLVELTWMDETFGEPCGHLLNLAAAAGKRLIRPCGQQRL
jgi:hypothetical protein